MQIFRDRRDAGVQLAQALGRYAGRSDVVVFGLPRGGMPVAYEIARRLETPLEVLVVRKLGVPGHEELAMGAIASGSAQFIDRDLVDSLGIPEGALQRIIERERNELARREDVFRGDRPMLDAAGKTVIVVDDGLATGSTMLAAIRALRGWRPARIVVAVPVGAADACDLLRPIVDEIICLVTPRRFRAVGLWYEIFSQTTDAEVRELLDHAMRDQPRRARAPADAGATAR